MEYRLNKIDLELRQKIKDATKEGQVHSKQSISITKDKKEQNRKSPQDFGYKLKKAKEKFQVEAVKVEDLKVEVYREDTTSSSLSSGTIINVKK